MAESTIARLERHTVFIMPWLQLQEDHRISDYSFLRWPNILERHRDDHLSNRFRQRLIENVSRPFQKQGNQVQQFTLLTKDATLTVLPEISKADRPGYHLAWLLFTISLLAANDYNEVGAPYVSSASCDAYSRHTKSQDGSFDTEFIRVKGRFLQQEGDDHSISAPLQCFGERAGRLEQALLNAFSEFHEGVFSHHFDPVEVDNIIQGCRVFIAAHRDDPLEQFDQKLINMAQAFDRLLGSPGSAQGVMERAYSALADKLSRNPLFRSRRYARAQSMGCTRFLSLHPDYLDYDLGKFWFWELYHYRSKYVHYDSLESDLWNHSQHMVIAAQIFPLMLKLKLSSLGCYHLNTFDEIRLRGLNSAIDGTSVDPWQDWPKI